jgi:hypothetical protein
VLRDAEQPQRQQTMEIPHNEHENSPPTPGITISRPTAYASIPTRTSDESLHDISDRRSRFEEDIDSGLGIQMHSVTPNKSPDVTYSTLDADRKRPGMFSPAPSVDPMTQRLIAHRATQSAQWRVHWRPPTLMIIAFLMGIVFALFQHLLYTSLHHKEEADENKKFRLVLYGRMLAYLSKVAFGGCVVLVFRQRLWRTFRERALTVLSIDQLFGATEDPSLFANWEAITNAPILVAVAMIIWLIPLATIIFSPGALTFGTYLDHENIDLVVPTLNFSMESTKNWRYPVKMADGSNKKSVMYYNTTDIAGTSPGWFDYYDQPSAELARIGILLAYSNMHHPNIRQGARQQACGGQYNCTYEQTFAGPGYQCEEIIDTNKLDELEAPFNFTKMAPLGRASYYAEVDIGDYKRPQSDEFRKGPGGVPVGETPASLGVFKSEPVLWIGYTVNSTKKLSPDDPLAKHWTHRFDPHIIRCVHMETKYTVKWNFTEPFFNTTTKREYIAPIVDTNFTRGLHGITNYTRDPEPAKNYISPRDDVGLYKKTAAYHAIGAMFRAFLRGHVDVDPPLPGPYYSQVYSDVTKTRLMYKNAEPKEDLGSEIEAFYSDMVLSLFSAPEMLTVHEEKLTVERSRLQSSFVYVPERLWKCYAPVIFVTLLILIFGLFTIWEDGTTFSAGFSRILVTTRNTTLDNISRGACLGNDPFPMELMNTRLKFGALAHGGDPQYPYNEYQGGSGFQNVGHCAFGVASEVGPIFRGEPYAGLPASLARTRRHCQTCKSG